MQKRSLETRAKLIEQAKQLIADKGYEGLRTEELVKAAGVAKGTFFSHFADKEVLMDLLLGAEIERCLDQISEAAPPKNVDDVIMALVPLISVMTSERYVFDVILRHSGATAIEEIGPIATTFARQVMVFAQWVEDGPFRNDIPATLVAEGIQAFLIQAMALKFCALHDGQNTRDILKTYLDAWLMPYALITDDTG